MQPRMLSKQLQAASLGVGGKVDDARSEELIAGQAGYVAAPAAFSKGVFGGFSCPYSASSESKSALGVTVLPSAEIFTIPNCPCALSAGKYENAIPPDQTLDIRLLKRAWVSVQSRGGDVMQPNSLK
jgi:hypothetical protein